MGLTDTDSGHQKSPCMSRSDPSVSVHTDDNTDQCADSVLLPLIDGHVWRCSLSPFGERKEYKAVLGVFRPHELPDLRFKAWY